MTKIWKGGISVRLGTKPPTKDKLDKMRQGGCKGPESCSGSCTAPFPISCEWCLSLDHLKQENLSHCVMPIQGITVHDTDVLELEVVWLQVETKHTGF